MEPKGSASKGLAGPGLWSSGPWLWLVVLSLGRKGWEGVEGFDYDDTQQLWGRILSIGVDRSLPDLD